MPKNAQAIKDWIVKNRPDLALNVDMYLQQDAFILLLSIGFEAGRQFQVDNPNLPLNSPSAYMQ
jgi:hypothetical protein